MKTLRKSLIGYFLLMTFFGAMLTGILTVSQYMSFIDGSIQTRLKGAVAAAEYAIDYSRLDELLRPGADKSTYFKESNTILAELVEKLDLEYLYVIIENRQGEKVFILDNGNTYEDPEEHTYMVPVEDWDSMDIAWESGEMVIDSEPYTDAWGTYLSSCYPLKNSAGKVIGVIGADISMVDISATKLTVNITLMVTLLISLSLGFLLAFFVSRSLAGRVNRMADALGEISSGDGDLTKRLENLTFAEMVRVGDNYNLFIEKISRMIGEIVKSEQSLSNTGTDLSANMQETSAALTEITANVTGVKKQIETQSVSLAEYSRSLNDILGHIDGLDGSIEGQAASLEESSASIEQMLGNIRSVTNSVRKSSTMFTELQTASDQGKSLIEQVSSQASEIEGQSAMLQEANTVIAGIASQTNLLAMNAAIEAAHAGEAGRGFSVVADEIRKLAEQSSLQSKSIRESLKTVLSSIEEISGSTKEADTAFEQVITMVSNLLPLTSQISNAMDEQNAGSSQILEALADLKDITGNVQDKSGSMKKSGSDMKTLLEQLNRISAELANSIVEIEQGTMEINRAAVNSVELADDNKQTIDQLSAQTSQFKI